MTERNNNWPPKHHGEHNPAGRTGNTDFDAPGLKGERRRNLCKSGLWWSGF
ncbi:Uncharacterised protein [Macrococcoides caseolyticum]|uniref:hypothetical protein n=1 Tax=Macrococcoides caseolyticum TaxID=69966 RepID=UPI000DFF93E6|nr:hypothetical protein [Macrococcus caseolyticus]STY75140.1 Uncharacterised protein [Macrococcus caseolyticus]